MKLSEAVRSTCAKHWPDLRTRCEGCPIFEPCNAPLPGPMTADSIAAHAARLNEAAAKVELMAPESRVLVR